MPSPLVKDVVRAHFASPDAVEQWASVYREGGDFFAHAMSARRAAALDLLRSNAPDTGPVVVDVGCGAGLVAQELLRLGYDVTGIDLSPEMLAAARGIPGLKLLAGDIEHLPLPPSSVDGLVCLGVISYLPDETRALAELHRVLKPGGRLILGVRNRLELAVLLDVVGIGRAILRRIRRRLDRRAAGTRDAYYHRNFVPWRLDAALRSAGFTVTRSVGCGFDFPSLGGRRLVPLSAGLRLSRALERLARKRGFGFLHRLGLVYLVAATRNTTIPDAGGGDPTGPLGRQS